MHVGFLSPFVLCTEGCSAVCKNEVPQLQSDGGALRDNTEVVYRYQTRMKRKRISSVEEERVA
jgi:hypothetical protein